MLVHGEQHKWLFLDPGPLMASRAQQARWKAYFREAAKSKEIQELDKYYRDQNAIDAPAASGIGAAASNLDAPPASGVSAAARSQSDDLVERNEQQEEAEDAKGQDIEFEK